MALEAFADYADVKSPYTLGHSPGSAQLAATAAGTKGLPGSDVTLVRRAGLDPEEQYHFEMGRGLAERLGYPAGILDAIPAQALASFAGVGFFLDLLCDAAGQRALDLGSGSGTDSFAAAHLVGPAGSVNGVDMTPAQLAKAEQLRAASGTATVRFVEGYIEDPLAPDSAFDAVTFNGVINLSADKASVFQAAARALLPGGRLALPDIVTQRPLTPS